MPERTPSRSSDDAPRERARLRREIEQSRRESERLREDNARLKREREQLQRDRDQLQQEREQLERERDRLRRDIERLTRALEAARRAGKRQAAPFSKGAPGADTGDMLTDSRQPRSTNGSTSPSPMNAHIAAAG